MSYNWNNNKNYNNNNRNKFNEKKPNDCGYDSEKNIYPYNFVSLGNKCDVSRRKKGNLTGYINISVTPKTDLIVPFEKENEKKYNFYKYNNSYVIPGSQMRGVVRNSYEALTNSCLSQMDEDYNVSFRYPIGEAIKWKPCVVKYTDKGWVILEATSYKLGNDTRNNNSKGVKSVITERPYYCKELNRKFSFNENKNFIIVDNKYILRFGEKTIKNGISIKLFEFSNKSYINDCNKASDVVENLKKNCQRYIDNLNELNTNATVDKNDNLYKDIINAINNKQSFVAYYNSNNNYLSPSNVGREMLKDTLDKMYIGYENCTDKFQLCPACALFGTVSNDKSLESRIRFTDLLLSNNGINTKYNNLVSLGSHLSNYRFYANKNWDAKDVRIRGRKYYWHHQVNCQNEENANTNINCMYETLCFNENNIKKFEGKIYFEDLTEKELKDLIFSIELGGNNHMLKLGHGKAFGFGSILCKCENIYLRDIVDNKIVENEYNAFERNTWNNYPNSKELELITKFDILKDKWPDIKYPGSPKWFADNKKLVLASITDVVKNKKSFNYIGNNNENKNHTSRPKR